MRRWKGDWYSPKIFDFHAAGNFFGASRRIYDGGGASLAHFVLAKTCDGFRLLGQGGSYNGIEGYRGICK